MKERTLSRYRMLNKTLVAVALGSLLGVAIAVPYDQVLGLSTPLCTVLQTLASAVVFTSLKASWPAELVVE